MCLETQKVVNRDDNVRTKLSNEVHNSIKPLSIFMRFKLNRNSILSRFLNQISAHRSTNKAYVALKNESFVKGSVSSRIDADTVDAVVPCAEDNLDNLLKESTTFQNMKHVEVADGLYDLAEPHIAAQGNGNVRAKHC